MVEQVPNNFLPKAFARPVGQLYNYAKAIHTLKWPGEMVKVVKASKELVLQYAVGVTESDSMEAKSQMDQSLILGSMLLCSSEAPFNAHFGFLRLHLESKYIGTWTSLYSQQKMCYSCKMTTNDNTYGVGTEHRVKCGITYIEKGTTNCPNCSRRGRDHRYCLTITKRSNDNEVARCSTYGVANLATNSFESAEVLLIR
jgi:hypothetical protein